MKNRNETRRRRPEEDKPRRHENNGSNDDDVDDAPEDSGVLARYVPSPIDLWQSQTLPSLLLLPFVLLLYVVLRIPLHHNSKSEQDRWRGLSSKIDDMSSNLLEVERELRTIRGGHDETKRAARSLRRRLDRLRERREARDEASRLKERERRRRELEEKQKRGMAGNGPLMAVSMVRALDVTTFAGGRSRHHEDESSGKKND